MSKSTVAGLFFGAVLALAVGLVIGVSTVVAALVGGAIHIGGPNVIHVDGSAVAGALPWLLMAALVFVTGEIAALASWIGALLNTWHLEDKAWFLALLVLGLFSFGWVAVAAYVFVGPDATGRSVPRSGEVTTPGT